MEIPAEVTELLSGAGMIYFAGQKQTALPKSWRLKTNEITRKKSDFLEGTYAAHGIEEVMSQDDVLVVIDPFPGEVEKFKECLTEGVGIKIISVGTEKTAFDHSVIIPEAGGSSELCRTGCRMGISLWRQDLPSKSIWTNRCVARKVGNEFIPG